MTVFLETTALIEIAFWDASRRAKVEKLFPENAVRITSQFVIYEVCRGFLRNLILLHNKAIQVTAFSELIAYGANSRFAPHRMGTILGAFEEFFGQAGNFPIQSPAELIADFRGNMRRKIRRGFSKMQTAVASVSNEVGCRSLIQGPIQDKDGYFDQKLNKDLCGKVNECGIKKYYTKHKADFETIRAVLDPKMDDETCGRYSALRELYRVANRDFQAAECYKCGDATISHECPKTVVLITKNEKHIKPILEALDKQGIYYK